MSLPVPLSSSSTPCDVSSYFRLQLQLPPEICALFESEEIDGSVLHDLGTNELIALGVKKLGYRIKILRCIKNTIGGSGGGGQPPLPPPPPTIIDHTNTPTNNGMIKQTSLNEKTGHFFLIFFPFFFQRVSNGFHEY